jgi:negative regulator of flagellin synthesis FlgM
MSSIELSKLAGVSAARPVATGERAPIEARTATPSPRTGTITGGISIEVGATADSAAPPVDAERVAQIREALRDGSYPLVPTQIVDAMIAAQVSFTLPGRD